MSSQSVSILLEKLKHGDDEAARRIWDLYFPELVELAARRLSGVPRRMEDQEDVALSALTSFCRAAKEGRCAQLQDREGLWRLLRRMTYRKAIDLIRRANRQFGDARARPIQPVSESGSDYGEMMAGGGMAVDLSMEIADQIRKLLDLLPDAELRQIALAKLEGATHAEIAAQLGCSVRTVERRLEYIRKIWKHELPRDFADEPGAVS